jgi:hypothetical protein
VKIIFLANQDYASFEVVGFSVALTSLSNSVFTPSWGNEAALDSGLAALAGLRIGNLTGTLSQRPEY